MAPTIIALAFKLQETIPISMPTRAKNKSKLKKSERKLRRDQGRPDAENMVKRHEALPSPLKISRKRRETNEEDRSRDEVDGSAHSPSREGEYSGYFSSKPQPYLLQMPPEMLDSIFRYLDQHDIVTLCPVHTTISDAALICLYHEPTFPTTYRLAQFVWIVSHCARYGKSVRILVICASIMEDAPQNMASWWEFKYRDQSLYAPNFTGEAERQHPKKNQSLSCSLPQSLGSIPFGMLLQILLACRNIRYVLMHDAAMYRD